MTTTNKTTNKKVLLVFGAVVVVILAAGGAYALSRHNAQQARKTAVSQVKKSGLPKPKITNTKACQYFTASDASKLLGKSVEQVATLVPEQTTDQTLYSSCIYRTKVSGTAKPRTISVIIRTNKNSEVTRKTFATLTKTLKATPVPGLGDEAYFVGLSSQLNVRKGGSWLTIFVGNPASGEPASLDVAKQAAKTILPQLQ